jgi:RNA polymerase sigma-70 factor (ECF subfamily)
MNSIRRSRISPKDFEDFINRYAKLVYNIAYRLTGNEIDAEDLAQEAFIKVYHNLNKYRPTPDGSFERWLYKVINNLYIDELRKKPKVKLDTLEDVEYTEDGEKEKFIIGDRTFDPERILHKKEFEKEIQNALSLLPVEFRTVLVLCDIEGFSYEEISKMLNIPIGTVRSRLNRARKILRNKLRGGEENGMQ